MAYGRLLAKVGYLIYFEGDLKMLKVWVGIWLVGEVFWIDMGLIFGVGGSCEDNAWNQSVAVQV